MAYGVPVGLGSHVHWDRRLDALLAQALMSIQAIKAVELGEGLALPGLRGTEAHDAIRMAGTADADGRLSGGYARDTHRAGGIEGGMSTGAPIVARASMKPLATLNRPSLGTVDVVTKESTVSFKERTDVTAVPAMGVVAETMTALVLASEAMRKFGGDSVAEFVRNRDGYLDSWARPPRRRGRSKNTMAERLLLVGMMGAGKTTVGRLLADRLGWGYLDSDAQVTRTTGRSVPEIFSEDGETAFRAEETRALTTAVSGADPMVVSVAGGAVLSEANRALLARSGIVVWLRARPETLTRRVGDGAGRPLLGDDPGGALAALYEVRRPLYDSVAAVTVDVDDLSPEAVADRVLSGAGLGPGATESGERQGRP